MTPVEARKKDDEEERAEKKTKASSGSKVKNKWKLLGKCLKTT